MAEAGVDYDSRALELEALDLKREALRASKTAVNQANILAKRGRKTTESTAMSATSCNIPYQVRWRLEGRPRAWVRSDFHDLLQEHFRAHPKEPVLNDLLERSCSSTRRESVYFAEVDYIHPSWTSKFLLEMFHLHLGTNFRMWLKNGFISSSTS